MKKVKWGVIGTANLAVWGTIPGMKLAENCELYAIAGRSKEKAQSFKERFGFQKAYGSYEELLADKEVEAVHIPLPNTLHLTWVKKALEAGKHVLCEKPLALNAREAAEMYELAKEKGLYLMEAYAYLHSPYVKSLRQEIDKKTIGDIQYIETAFITQGYKEDIRLKKELGGGAMYDLGCYCSTMILSLVDADPIYARGEAEFSSVQEGNVDLMTAGILKFDNGVRASFNVGMILGKDTNARFDRLYIYGTKGCIKSDVEYNYAGSAHYTVYTEEGAAERTIEIPNNYALEFTQFGKCVLGEEKPYITPEFSLRNARLMDMILEEIGYN